MAMTKMQYKNFIFDINPSDIKLTLKKNLAKTNVMHSTQVCSEVGESVAVISGKGRFVGENAIKKHMNLSGFTINKVPIFFLLRAVLPCLRCLIN